MATKKKALVLGGGAPNLTLMSGALLALHQAGVKFEVIYMAGGGGVVGCVYMAPRTLTPAQALEDTINLAVSDSIYEMFPINYKVFNKGGPSATAFRDYWRTLPEVQRAMNQYGQSNVEKLYSDWVLLNGAMICPTDVNFFSRGICGHVPFIENLVDFEKLKTVDPHYTLTAYCIEEGEVYEFHKPDVGVHEFRASLSFPFIYPPYRIDENYYYEGAAVESLSLISVMQEYRSQIDQVIVFDVLTKDLIHRPRNLVDAYAQSIIVPLVANAEKELAMFEYWIKTGVIVMPIPNMQQGKMKTGLMDVVSKMGPEGETAKPPGLDLLKIKFDVPDDRRPYLLDWSRSNLENSFRLGYEAGQRFVYLHPEVL
jgi:predicted acylesterase/phospholipase RssA